MIRFVSDPSRPWSCPWLLLHPLNDVDAPPLSDLTEDTICFSFGSLRCRSMVVCVIHGRDIDIPRSAGPTSIAEGVFLVREMWRVFLPSKGEPWFGSGEHGLKNMTSIAMKGTNLELLKNIFKEEIDGVGDVLDGREIDEKIGLLRGVRTAHGGGEGDSHRDAVRTWAIFEHKNLPKQSLSFWNELKSGGVGLHDDSALLYFIIGEMDFSAQQIWANEPKKAQPTGRYCRLGLFLFSFSFLSFYLLVLLILLFLKVT
jgi:hypothetical protein